MGPTGELVIPGSLPVDFFSLGMAPGGVAAGGIGRMLDRVLALPGVQRQVQTCAPALLLHCHCQGFDALPLLPLAGDTLKPEQLVSYGILKAPLSPGTEHQGRQERQR